MAKKTHEQYMKDFHKKNIYAKDIEVLGKYNGAREPIEVMCKIDGHIWSPLAGSLLSNHGCPKCYHRNRKLTHKEFMERFYDNNENAKYIDILNEYIDSNTYIECRCLICEHEWKTKPFILLNNHGCPQCAFNHNGKKWLGENNPRYNPNLTDEEREDNRRDIKRKEWAKEVKEKDNYTCQCCGSRKSGTLRSHHLYSHDKYKCLRYVVENGTVLCEDCHKEFHHLYGYGNNTKEQFDEWINNKDLDDRDIS